MNAQQIIYYLQDKCQINTSDRILVGVSGGADSMCLLHLLKQSGFTVFAAHLDHAIRPESAQDAIFVEQICKDWSIPFVTQRVDVPAYAVNQHLSIEEAARVVRYHFLFRSAGQVEAEAVAVAHHANDQTETVLMHFVRGSGLDGLRGMLPCSLNPDYHQSIRLIRPLLSIWKDEIVEYCQIHAISYVDDATNSETKYYRNWLRHHLIPELETKNPAFQSSMVRMAEVITGQHTLLTERIEQEWSKLDIQEGSGWIGFSYTRFREASLPVMRELLRKAIRKIKPDLRDLDFHTIERVCSWCASQAPHGPVEVLSGIMVERRDTLFIISLPGVNLPVAGYPQLEKDGLYLIIPGTTKLNPEWSICVEESDYKPVFMDYIRSAGQGEAFLDLEKVRLPIRLRTRMPGDRMTLLGQGIKTQKLADLFINQKVPVYARENYPMLEASGTIIWIPGVQISESVKVTAQTRRMLHLKLVFNG